VGAAVRAAAAAGIRGVDMTGDLLAKSAIEVAGQDFGLASLHLRAALDPRAIVGSRVTRGGAEPGVVRGMAAEVMQAGRAAAARAVERREGLDAAEGALLAHARRIGG
jgi:hypothetical protein